MHYYGNSLRRQGNQALIIVVVAKPVSHSRGLNNLTEHHRGILHDIRRHDTNGLLLWGRVVLRR